MKIHRWIYVAAIALGLLLASNVALAVAYRYRAQVSVTGTVTTSVQPGLAVDLAIVNFDGFEPGTKSEVRTVELSNIGARTLRRLRLEATGLPAGLTFLASWQTSGLPLAPGQKMEIYLQFQADASVPDNTALTGIVVIRGE